MKAETLSWPISQPSAPSVTLANHIFFAMIHRVCFFSRKFVYKSVNENFSCLSFSSFFSFVFVWTDFHFAKLWDLRNFSNRLLPSNPSTKLLCPTTSITLVYISVQIFLLFLYYLISQFYPPPFVIASSTLAFPIYACFRDIPQCQNLFSFTNLSQFSEASNPSKSWRHESRTIRSPSRDGGCSSRFCVKSFTW